MAVYIAQKPGSRIEAAELTPISDGNFAFFHCRDGEKAEALKQWLTSPEVGQEIVAESIVGGKPVLVTHGDKSNSDLLALLDKSGDTLKPQPPEKSFDAWKMRGMMSNIGQSLNLISAYRKPTGIDAPKLTFAGLNFAASFVNATFGGQKSEDEYQLQHLKENINRLLGKHLSAHCKLPDIHDKPSEHWEDPAPPKTVGQRFSDMMQANSVRIGEIGLRYMGAIAMTFPIKNWKPVMAKMRQGATWSEMFALARNKDTTNFYTGATYLVGKTVGLFSKVPDPYNPAPHTALDTVREKYLFKASSLIEAGAAATLAMGNLKADKNGKRDLIGAGGGAALTAGLLTRLFAKFGTREVDMDDLYAHTLHLLAMAEPKQLPQMLADAAAAIKDHFKDMPEDYGFIYTKMMTDLYRYHHIALDNLGTEPDERLARLQERQSFADAISREKTIPSLTTATR